MKNIAITLALSSTVLLAGEPPAYVEAAPMSPQPNLLQWFAGASVGYLLDNEEEFYSGHIGFDLPQQAFGSTQSIFLEVGYTEFDEREDTLLETPPLDLGVSPLGEVASNGTGSVLPTFITERVEIEIIPITLNYKLERQLTQNLNGYFGLGAGVALIDAEFSGAVDADDDDTTFFAQVFTGLLYNVNESFELFSGLRWIYIDDSDLFGVNFDSEDDFVAEFGARFNF